MMDIERIKKELPSCKVALNDPTAEGKYCIVEKAGLWEVFFYERGHEIGKKFFFDEKQALNHLKQLIS